ncbi:Pre-mRNA-processing factor 39 [Hordeum vulgare]|nr:Pre-mRNA-processing factor 39 [Hordeum vulgare]
MAGGFPNKGKAPLFPCATSPPSSSHRPRQRVSVPVHQARWHWEHRVALPYPDVTLPHGWHLDLERIPVTAVPRSTRVHAEEVTKRRHLLTAEQRRDPTYVADSPNWEVWFVVEHEEQRRRGVRQVQPGGPPPPPPVVSDEDQEAEAAYQVALAGVLRDSEEEARRMAEEEAAFQKQIAEAMALSAAGDCVVPPPPEPEPEPTLSREVYQWTGVVQEFVSVPPIWLGATPLQEQAYLEHWRSVHLQAERAEGLWLMELEKEEEEERREAEEEERGRAVALPPPPPQPAPAGQTTEAQAA